jgi:hypothetical protein
MRVPCTIRQLSGGQWRVVHRSAELGTIEVVAPRRDDALEKMRGELRYRLELCPCSGESYQHIDLELVEAVP